jgi:Ca2+-binding RTX toxin-like protein
MSANPLATEGDDQLNGTVIGDYIEAYGGDDVVFGAGGSDSLVGGLGNDTLYADTYAGYAGADTAAEWNALFGAEGDDTLVSGAGLDDLWGGSGNDTLTGGTGMDWFVFEPGSGVDVVTDFTVGEDQIVVMANMNGVGDPVVSENQYGTIVDFGGGNVAVLAGVGMASLATDSIVVAPYQDVPTFYQSAVPFLLS